MSADFKSHILSRDEKGFGGVPFKRLLFGGIGGGLAYTVCRFALPDIAIPTRHRRRAAADRVDRPARRPAALAAALAQSARIAAARCRIEAIRVGGRTGADCSTSRPRLPCWTAASSLRRPLVWSKLICRSG